MDGQLPYGYNRQPALTFSYSAASLHKNITQALRHIKYIAINVINTFISTMESLYPG